MTAIVLGVLLIGLAIGIPVAFVFGLAAAAAFTLTTAAPLDVIAQRFYAGLNSFPIMAIPFFILAGVIMESGGVSRRIIDFSSALVGWITGSLLQVSIFAATGLAALSGSGTADTAAIVSVLTPEIRRRKYDVDFALAVMATAGSHAQIIPPSLTMVIFAVVNNMSIGAIFLAGLLPGLISVPALSLVAYLHAKRGGERYRDPEPFSLARVWKTFWAAVPALGMAAVILIGIVGGFFTPTEAACVAVWYGLFVGLFVYRAMTWRDLPKIFIQAAAYSSGILLIIGTGNVFGYLMAVENIPAALESIIIGSVSSAFGYLLLVNVLLLVLGCLCDTIVYILVLSPVLLKIAVHFGIDPVHFAIIMIFNLCIGLITPPVGGAVFVASVVGQRPFMSITRKMLWPFISMVAVLFLITYVPEITLLLPRLSGLAH